MYYDLYTEKKTVPTIIFLLILLLILFLLISVSKKRNQELMKRNSAQINQFEIGNITASSFSVFWRSTVPASSYIKYGTDQNKLDNITYQTEDKKNNLKDRNNHFLTIDGLQANTKYYFVFVLNGSVVKNINNKPFIASTGVITKKTSKYNTAYGKIINEKQLPVGAAVVLLKMEEIYPLITQTKDDGSFLISLKSLYSKKNLVPVTGINSKDIKLEIINEQDDRLTVSTNIDNISPNAGKIVLKSGKSTLYAKKTNKEQNVLGKSKNIRVYDTVDIFYPELAASIPDNKPLFKGISLPETLVKGTILPEKFIFEVKSDSKGVWSHEQLISLNSGAHQLIISSIDNNNKKIEKKRNFFIQKSGEAVLGEATPSAALTPTSPATSVTPVITATVSATVTPPSVTGGAPTILVTATPPPPIITVEVTPVAPTSGISDIISYASISFALIILGMGLIMLF